MEGTPFGRYRLIALLGRGGMGEVWRAYDTGTDRQVAIKILHGHYAQDATFQRRFRREAHAAAGVNNQHVVPIHDFGEIDGKLFVDMRVIDGQDLAEILSIGALPPSRAVNVVEQVARALQAAHRVDLIHRDVKPSNILITEDDFAYLIDFGIARVGSDTSLTTTGSTLGTWAYMAPERFTTGNVDARSDVYALTCVLYECLTGQMPFPGSSLEQVAAGHMFGEPPRPTMIRPSLPGAIDEVVAAGLAKNPDERLQGPVELARAARQALTPTLSTSPGTTATAEAPPLATFSSAPTAHAADFPAVHDFAAAPTQHRQTPPPARVPSDVGPPAARKWWRRRPVLTSSLAIVVVACIVAAVVAAVVWQSPDNTNHSSAQGNGQPLPAGHMRIASIQMPSISSPDPALATGPAASSAAPSVVKIRAVAPGCGNAASGVIVSTGFVVTPDRIMTTAHTLSGSTSTVVEAGGRAFDATVVSHNSLSDIAILAVDGFPGTALALAAQPAPTGASAVVAGYPDAGRYMATPSRIAEVVELQHHDIYGRQPIDQEVYTFVGGIKEGDTGAPLLDSSGTVLGMVFALAVDDPNVGFAISASELERQMSQVGNSRSVTTGACID